MKLDHEMESLRPYLRSVRIAGPMTREEEHALAVRAKAGDRAAAHKLLRQHLPLVVAVARKQRRGTLRLEELVQEGNLGLLRALEKFDPGAGTRFSTYAVWWIRAYVWKYLKQARSAVRPQSGTVAQADYSLDRPVGEEEGDVSFLERIEDEGPGPDEEFAEKQDAAALRGLLQKVRGRLGELGWDIVHSRLQADPPDTLEQIGKRHGVSRERVRQVELQTKRFLRVYLAPANETAREVEAA